MRLHYLLQNIICSIYLFLPNHKAFHNLMTKKLQSFNWFMAQYQTYLFPPPQKTHLITIIYVYICMKSPLLGLRLRCTQTLNLQSQKCLICKTTGCSTGLCRSNTFMNISTFIKSNIWENTGIKISNNLKIKLNGLEAAHKKSPILGY